MNGNQIVNVYDAAGCNLRTTPYTLNEPLATPATQVLHLSYVLGSVKETTIIYDGNQQTKITRPHKEMLERPHTTYMYTTEGYVTKYFVKTQEYPKYTYYYYRRDHLGNNVAVWNATEDSTVQRTFYYASGLPMSCSTGQSAQSRKYNGKDYVEDHGFDVYDYGFRGYYATIGRFTSIDPLAEQTPWQSPYVYADNNFVNNIDYWGLAAGASGSGGVYTTSDPDKIAALLEHLSKNNSLDGFDLSDWESGFGSAKWWIDETNGTFSFTYVTNGGGGGGIMDGGTRIDDWDIINVTLPIPSAHCLSLLGDMIYSKKSDWHSIYDLGKGVLSTGFSIAGKITHNELYWIGKNGKFYTRDLRFKQGGWAYSYKVVGKSPTLKGIRGVGKGLSYVVAAIDVANFIQQPSVANGFELCMDGLGFIPGIGWVISTVYFIANTIVDNKTGFTIGEWIENSIY